MTLMRAGTSSPSAASARSPSGPDPEISPPLALGALPSSPEELLELLDFFGLPLPEEELPLPLLLELLECEVTFRVGRRRPFARVLPTLRRKV